METLLSGNALNVSIHIAVDITIGAMADQEMRIVITRYLTDVRTEQVAVTPHDKTLGETADYEWSFERCVWSKEMWDTPTHHVKETDYRAKALRTTECKILLTLAYVYVTKRLGMPLRGKTWGSGTRPFNVTGLANGNSISSLRGLNF